MIYEGAITDRFKEIIRADLYDTGALYDSLQIFSYEVPDAIYFDVQCEEYIVYHIDRLNLLERLSELDEFQEAYEKYLQISVEEDLARSLSSLDAPDPDFGRILPRCFITLNGQ